MQMKITIKTFIVIFLLGIAFSSKCQTQCFFISEIGINEKLNIDFIYKNHYRTDSVYRITINRIDSLKFRVDYKCRKLVEYSYSKSEYYKSNKELVDEFMNKYCIREYEPRKTDTSFQTLFKIPSIVGLGITPLKFIYVIDSSYIYSNEIIRTFENFETDVFENKIPRDTIALPLYTKTIIIFNIISNNDKSKCVVKKIKKMNHKPIVIDWNWYDIKKITNTIDKYKTTNP